MTRMLVDPLRTKGTGKHADLVGCTGVTMEDGRVFRANRQGHIDVDDARTAKQMVDNPLAPGMVLEQKFSGAGAPGATCTSCGFGAFRWQISAPCPKCGGEIKEDQ